MVGEVPLFNESDGVSQKFYSQAKAFFELGAKVECIGYDNNKIVSTVCMDQGYTEPELIAQASDHRIKRFILWACMHKYVKGKQYDLIYIRYPIIDLFFVRALKSMRKASDHLIMEIPSYPLEYTGTNIVRKMQFELDHLLQNKCGKLLDRIVYVGNKTDIIFGCKAKQIANGIPERITFKESTGYQIDNNCINLICVSNMYPIHGYDRLIRGLGKYYNDSSNPSIEVNVVLVGDGPCKKRYEALTEEYSIHDHVCFPGVLKGKALTDAYDTATLGVGSLGMYREGFEEASSLKTKEYLIRGLPFVYAVNEIGLSEDFPFALKVSNSDDDLDIIKIIEFVEVLSQYDAKKVIDEMKEYAYCHYSWFEIIRDACGDYLDIDEAR